MKYLLAFGFLFSVAFAQSLPEQYVALSPEAKLNYETVLAPIKPKLAPLERELLSVASNTTKTRSQKVQMLSDTEKQLEAWVGDSMIKYVLMLPLRTTVAAQIEALATEMVLRVPYQPHQIKSQFDINGAQLYAYGAGNLTLIRGTLEKGVINRGDKVIIYFKQGGPVITSIEEVVSDPADAEDAFLLSDKVPPVRFVGGAAVFIPQR